MRNMMGVRLLKSMPDRRTILEFIEWLEFTHGGKLTILLPSGSNQEIGVETELDRFHDIDRQRLAEERERYEGANDYTKDDD